MNNLNSKIYTVEDFELSFDVPVNTEFNTYGLNWRIPVNHYENKMFPGYEQMSRSEQIVCRLCNDPFLFHSYILEYTNYAHQGEWLNEIASNEFIQLLAPTDFGKSTAVSVSYPLWKYFKNCNIRVGIISGAEDQTEASMREIEEHLERNSKFKEVFKLRWGHDPIPDKKKVWKITEKLCYRTRPVGARDATFFGLGLFGSSWGKRIDLLILDDFISPKDFITRNEERIRNIQKQLEEVLITRLGSDGELKSIGTFHEAYDTYNFVINKYWDSFKLLKYRALTRKGEDYRIDISKYKKRESDAKKRGEEYSIPDFMKDGVGASDKGFWYDKLTEDGFYSLCPERWTVTQLQKRAKRMSTTAFCKKYQLALGLSSDRDIDPMWVDRCIQLGKSFIINPDGTNNIPFKFAYKIGGVDLSSGTKRGKFTAIIIIGFTEDGMRIPLWLYQDKIPFPTQKREIARKWAQFNVNYMIVESNAYQVSMTQDLKVDNHIFQELGLPTQSLPIRAAFTSSNKNDDVIGIPAIAGLLELGSMIIPSGNQFTRELFAPFVNELKTYPGVTTDTVMATWFAECFARTKLGYKSKFYLGANPTKRITEPEAPIVKEEVPFIKQAIKDALNENQNQKFNYKRNKAGSRIYKSFSIFGRAI